MTAATVSTTGLKPTAPAWVISDHWRARVSPRRLVVLAPVVFGIVLSQIWFIGGSYIASGDISVFERAGLRPELTSLWNHQGSGAGSAASVINHAPEILLLRISHLLGGGGPLAQRLLFATVMTIVGAGCAAFARRVFDDPYVAALAGCLAMLNPLFMTQLPNVIPYLSMGMIGAALALVIDASRGRVRPVAFGVITLGLSYLSINPPTVVAVGLVVVLAGLVLACRSKAAALGLLRLLLVGGGLAVLLNLWWILPVLQSVTGDAGAALTATTDVRQYAFVYGRSGLTNVLTGTGAWSWPHKEYFPWSPGLDRFPLSALRYALPLSALGALSIGRVRRSTSWLLLAGAGLVFLCKGPHSPLAGISFLLYDHVPYFYQWREPINKFGPALALVLATAAAASIVSLVRRGLGSGPDRRLWMVALAAFLVASVGVFSHPILSGSVITGPKGDLPSSHVSLPDYWHEAADHLNAEPTGKVLQLPLDDFYQMPTSWGYYGADVTAASLVKRPIMQVLPGGYYGNTGLNTLLHSAEDDLVQLSQRTSKATVATLKANLTSTLASLGVSSIIVRHDIDLAYPGRKYADSNALDQGVAKLGGGTTTPIGRLNVTDLMAAQSVVPVTANLAVSSWHEDAPGTYSADVTAGPGINTLELREAFAPGWALTGLPQGAYALHTTVDGYANGWTFLADGTFHVTLHFGPGSTAHRALQVSEVTAVLLVVIGGGLRLRRRLAGRERAKAPAPQA